MKGRGAISRNYEDDEPVLGISGLPTIQDVESRDDVPLIHDAES